jgi:hypothetical protein
MNKSARGYLIQDLMIIIMSIFLAVVLVQTHILADLLSTTKDYGLLGSFVAGLFFTSIFTTAPSVVALGEISQMQSVIQVAFVGAAGAMLGDLLIFQFIRDKLSEHLMELMKGEISDAKRKFRHHLKFFRWLTFFIGGIIIASPLPDELGVGLLGLSKMNTVWFAPLSFLFNFIGILIVGIVANAI